MATAAEDQVPTLSEEMARAVIAPESYAEWDGLLDHFDWLRENMPVGRIVAADGSFDPFWLITRYDKKQRVYKSPLIQK